MSRTTAMLSLLCLVLAGCAGAPGKTAPESATGLPPPAGGNTVGASVMAAANGTAGWKQACLQQWSSRAYTFRDPPVVAGKGCLFYPTPAGTLYWTVVANATDQQTVPAAAFARQDGFFDWAFVTRDGVVSFQENGTLAPRVLGKLPVSGRPLVVSGARIGQTYHLAVVDDGRNPGASPTTDFALDHFWWKATGETGHELTAVGFPFDLEHLRTGADAAVAVRGSIVSPDSAILVATTGAFREIPVPGLHVLDAVAAGGFVHACASGPGGYYYLQFPLVETSLPSLPEFVAPALLAPLAFSCVVAVGAQGPTLVFDSPRFDGNDPSNPLGGSVAATRTGPATWVLQSIGFTYWSGAALVAVRGSVVHVGETGNGTASGNPRDGTEVRIPEHGDATAPWHKAWGNFGRTAYPIDDPDRLLVIGEMWANPPFEYPDFGTTPAVTWAVVDATVPGLTQTAS